VVATIELRLISEELLLHSFAAVHPVADFLIFKHGI
jgi:hypothetical protein